MTNKIKERPNGVGANVLYFDTLVRSSNFNRSIMFTFGLIFFGKAWNHLLSSYELDNTTIFYKDSLGIK